MVRILKILAGRNKVIDAYVLMNPECKAVNIPEVWSGMSEYYDIKHHYERIEEKNAPAEEKVRDK